MMKTTAKTRRVRSNNREAQRVSPAPPTPGEYEAVENPLIWAPEDDLAALRKENAELRKAHAQMSAVYKLTEGRESAWLAYKAQAETVHAQQVADLGRLREQLRDARLGAY